MGKLNRGMWRGWLVCVALWGSVAAPGGSVQAEPAQVRPPQLRAATGPGSVSRAQPKTVDILADFGTDLGYVFVRAGDTVRVHVKEDFTSSSRLWYAVNDDAEGVVFQRRSADRIFNGYGVTFTYAVQKQARGTVSLLFVLVNPKLEQHPNSALMWVKLRVLP